MRLKLAAEVEDDTVLFDCADLQKGRSLEADLEDLELSQLTEKTVSQAVHKTVSESEKLAEF